MSQPALAHEQGDHGVEDGTVGEEGMEEHEVPPLSHLDDVERRPALDLDDHPGAQQ